MSLKYWLLVPLIMAGAVALTLFVAWRARRTGQQTGRTVPVAHLEQLKVLPSYQRLVRLSRLLRVLRFCLLLLMIAVLTAVLARPQKQTNFVDTEKTRDIVICMDVSNSMNAYAADGLEALKEIVTADRTDRFAIVLFQNAPFTAVTLTRDTAILRSKAQEISEGLLSENHTNLWQGAGLQDGRVNGTDLAAGMQGCLNRFDQLDKPRSRHLIFLSDFKHDPNGGNPERAAEVVAKAGVQTYFMYPGTFDADNLTVLSKLTAAQTYGLANPQATTQVVNEVYQTIRSDRDVRTYLAIDSPYVLLMVAALLSLSWFGFELWYWGWRRQI